jgi:hypothetical protein
LKAKSYERRTRSLLPPSRFRPASSIQWAIPSREEPGFISSGKRKYRGLVKKGIEYEQALNRFLLERFESLYVPSPWFKFQELGSQKVRWCQPDGLLFLPLMSRIVIVEAKLKHTSDAWWQVRHLYLPVIAHMFPPDSWSYSVVEVVQWYDRDTPFPEKVTLCHDVLVAEPGEFGVHIWQPR